MGRRRIRTDIVTEGNKSNIKVYLRRQDLRVPVRALGAAVRLSERVEDLLNVEKVGSSVNLSDTIQNKREDVVAV